MLKQQKTVWKVLLAGVLSLVGAVVGSAVARQQGDHATTSASSAPANVKAGKADPQVLQLLVLMDKDQNGKISKQEFTTFMEAEFERLDINKDGELDVEELSKENATPLRAFVSGPNRPR